VSVLRAVGWWVETPADLNLPAPQELVGELSPTTRAALVKHLRSGLRHVQYRGYSWCRFCCGAADSSMGSCDLTDGIWVWPEGLVHYIEAHSVVVPHEFIEHVLSGRAATKPDPTAAYDADYWIRWCADHRIDRIEQGIHDAIARACAELSVTKAQRVEVLEREQGLSPDKCAWVACTRKALTGRTLCAEHHAQATEAALTQTSLYQALRSYLARISASSHV
jgi:hypothetical protein